jgi:hypothetical protein
LSLRQALVADRPELDVQEVGDTRQCVLELTSGQELFGLEHGVSVGVLIHRIGTVLVVPDLHFGESVRSDIDGETICIGVEVVVDNPLPGTVGELPIDVVRDPSPSVSLSIPPAGVESGTNR